MKSKRNQLIVLYLLTIFCFSSQIEQTEQTIPSNNVKIFDVVEYKGDDLNLKTRLEYLKSIVYYFIIYEKVGLSDQQKFRILKFQEYSHQIIYLPIRTFPHQEKTLNEEEKINNQKYIHDSPLKVFKLLIEPQDLLIIGDQKNFISRQSLQLLIQGNNNKELICPTIKSLDQDTNIIQDVFQEKTTKIVRCGSLTQTYKDSLFDVLNMDCPLPNKEMGDIIYGWRLRDGEDQTIKQNIDKNSNQIQFRKVLNICIRWFKKLKAEPLQFPEKKITPIYTGNPKRQIYSVFPYNGQEHILKLKFAVSSSYVDYYVITQGFYSHCGAYKKLTFNYSLFPEVAHKIIYIPLRNMPFKVTNNSITDYECWVNEYFMRNSASAILDLISFPEDVISTEDCDEILSREAIQRFDPNIVSWANTQLRLFLFYLNQKSCYYNDDGKEEPNYSYNAIKLIVFKQLVKHESLTIVRRTLGCNTDVSSRLSVQKKQLKCDGLVIERAGWHFTYVLDEYNLNKKLRNAADSAHNYKKIQNVTFLKTGAVAPGAHNVIVTIENGDFPSQLVIDLVSKDENSIYAPYFLSSEHFRLGSKPLFNLQKKKDEKINELSLIKQYEKDQETELNQSAENDETIIKSPRFTQNLTDNHEVTLKFFNTNISVIDFIWGFLTCLFICLIIYCFKKTYFETQKQIKSFSSCSQQETSIHQNHDL